MKLRIVSGTLKGRMITIPARDQDFRPTRERIREAVASIVTNKIHNANVADICAGSGAFGFEMLSRGARHVLFLDSNRFRCDCIKKHAGQFHIADHCSIINQNISAFISQCTSHFDIIYYDPPYDEPVCATYLHPLQSLLSPEGILIYEYRSGTTPPLNTDADDSLDFEIRTYGETEVYIFRKRPKHDQEIIR